MSREGVLGQTVVVTGAFSYTGKYTTRQLLQRGYSVRTLTSHSRPSEFGAAVESFPFNFENLLALQRSLQGATTLVNTYWVRFPKDRVTFETAIKNTLTLFHAAKKAGIRRIVHMSIANPSLAPNLDYYRGKAILESALAELQLPFSILRPTVIFGREDILINNIAWFLRRFPVFMVPGDGKYRIRPIYVEDMARLLADAVTERGNQIVDAIGPEAFTFDELVRRIAASLGRSPSIVHVPTPLAYVTTSLMGQLLGDVILTRQEYAGLMNGLLAPEGPATGVMRLSDWLKGNCEELGTKYSSEVARHFQISARNHTEVA